MVQENREMLKACVDNFSVEGICAFLRRAWPKFRPDAQSLRGAIDKSDAGISDINLLGTADLSDTERVVFVSGNTKRELSTRSGKLSQYKLARTIIKEKNADAGIFVFFDVAGNFRVSMVHTIYAGTRRQFNNFRRYTYLVLKGMPNKTFINQIGRASFGSIDDMLGAFSIEAVSDAFYKDFMPCFDKMVQSVKGTGRIDEERKRDFALLFAIRIIFLGFVQKKGWLGEDDSFIRHLWEAYSKSGAAADTFYIKWLEPLFFDALNAPPGRKPAGINVFPPDIRAVLSDAPYLHGEIFKRNSGYDDLDLRMADKAIGEFLAFLFQHNFTIEENTFYDEELELNPEFLGIIFERLVNKANGAVYTPRTEVDLMCRLALVKWLERNADADQQALYELLFREGGAGGEFDARQKSGDFAPDQIEKLTRLIESATVCDPAAGSGAFEVGMLHVLHEVLDSLANKSNAPDSVRKKTAFERKKDIIARQLYGVEVERWAVWINQLRLWLTLFIDMPDEYRKSTDPLLPSLNFKVRCGDSLVQRIGTKMFPVHGHAHLSDSLKKKISKLQQLKNDFFHNRLIDSERVRVTENDLYREILDEEVAELKKNLSGGFVDAARQLDLFGVEPEPPSQPGLTVPDKQKQKIQAAIDELEQQKRAISRDHPLIWNIEFAEIFFGDRAGFDIIIGNPPYVRQEDIKDPAGKLDPKDYKQFLQTMARIDFAGHFTPKRKIDGKSDLYAFFYIRSLRLLNSGGVHVFICSNSWLDVGYGAWIQEFLIARAPVHLIVDNHARRSFASADVNTIISVIGAPMTTGGTIDDHIARFVAFRKPFEEAALTENLLEIERATKVTKTDAFRVYPIAHRNLREEGSEFETDAAKQMGTGTYLGDKWGGKYLRAPDIFFTIMEKGATQIGTFDKYFTGERYLNTGGADGFFVLTEFNLIEAGKNALYEISNSDALDGKNGFAGRVEAQFLKPLVKDVTKKNKRIIIDKTDALCLVVNDQLSESLRKYIKWGERQGFNERSVTKLQRPWYKPTNQMLSGAEILLPRSFNDVFVIHFNPNKFLSLRFYRLHVKETYKLRLKNLLSYLNSTVFWTIFETMGNKNLGQGVIDFFMEQFLTMKIPIVMCDVKETVFNSLAKREILSIFTECGIDPSSSVPIEEQNPTPLPDRKELDDVVFDALDLNAEERKEVYRAVCRLVWNRISKAKSVKKR